MTSDPERTPFEGLRERDEPPERTLSGRWYDAFDSVRFRRSLWRVVCGTIFILWAALDWGNSVLPRWGMLVLGIGFLIYAVPAVFQEWEKPGPDDEE